MDIGKGISTAFPVVCPNCHGENVHHGAVEMYERVKEDAESGLVVRVVSGQVSLSTDQEEQSEWSS